MSFKSSRSDLEMVNSPVRLVFAFRHLSQPLNVSSGFPLFTFVANYIFSSPWTWWLPLVFCSFLTDTLRSVSRFVSLPRLAWPLLLPKTFFLTPNDLVHTLSPVLIYYADRKPLFAALFVSLFMTCTVITVRYLGQLIQNIRSLSISFVFQTDELISLSPQLPNSYLEVLHEV